MYLGIDLGTSSTKVVLAAQDGQVLARSSAPSTTRRHGPDGATQSPDEWETSLIAALAGLPDHLLNDVDGVAVDGHVPSLLPVDADGRVLHECLTWQDNRPQQQTARLERQLGDLTEHIGVPLPWSPSQLPAKAAWLAEHVEVGKVAALLSPKDLLNHRLTGELATDAWTSKGLVDVRNRTAAAAVLQAAGWPPDVMPPIRQPWQPIGAITQHAAERFGLRAGTPVACGWTDAMAAFLAVGAFDAPGAAVLSGTSEIVGRTVSPQHDELGVPGLYTVPASVAPLPVLYGPTQSSGASLLWVARTLGLSVDAALTAAAAASDDFPLFLPYLDGERAPLWDHHVRGAFIGLDSRHGPGELVRGVLTGAGLSARHILDLAGTPATDAIAIGGRGAGHPAWLSARGIALGRHLGVTEEPSLTAFGAARLAAWASTGSLPAHMTVPVQAHTPSDNDVARGAELTTVYLSAATAAQEWRKP